MISLNTIGVSIFVKSKTMEKKVVGYYLHPQFGKIELFNINKHLINRQEVFDVSGQGYHAWIYKDSAQFTRLTILYDKGDS